MEPQTEKQRDQDIENQDPRYPTQRKRNGSVHPQHQGGQDWGNDDGQHRDCYDGRGYAFFLPPFFPNNEITGVINLGRFYLTLPPNLNKDLGFFYVVSGVPGEFDGTLITVVPEPSTLAILAFLSLVTYGWRQHPT